MSKLIYGVGTNSGGKYKTNGKMTNAYKAWQNMLRRAYCPKLHAVSPTYVSCSVADEWLDYQDFAEWFEAHEYSDCGYQLDKDLLVISNKVYGPETCCFVPQELNSLFLDRGAARGDLPQGVSWYKQKGKYRAMVGVDDKKQEHLGYFDTPQEAHQAYKKAKEAHVKRKALKWQDRIADDVFEALMQWTLDS